jgi:hypothetical protein
MEKRGIAAALYSFAVAPPSNQALELVSMDFLANVI